MATAPAARAPHYPQSDEPLCCCEYRDRHGHRATILGFFCACDELDQAADRLLTGRGVSGEAFDELISEIDDRLRVPWFGGAWHIGVPGALPWMLLPWLLLIGGISARFLLLCLALTLPSLLWWHRRTLKLRRRTGLLYSWMLASLAYETCLYAIALRFEWLAQSSAATAAFATPLMLALLLLIIIRRVDPTCVEAIADADAATSRTHRCAVCGVRVPRYDHYCAWVDAPIGAANHRAYIAFVAAMIATCAIGSAQLLHAAGVDFSDAWRTNASSVLLSFGLYGMAIACAVCALLAHQLSLILSGYTNIEARHRGRPAADGDKPMPVPPSTVNGCVSSFLRQTAPLSATLAAAWAGRGASATAKEATL